MQKESWKIYELPNFPYICIFKNINTYKNSL